MFWWIYLFWFKIFVLTTRLLVKLDLLLLFLYWITTVLALAWLHLWALWVLIFHRVLVGWHFLLKMGHCLLKMGHFLRYFLGHFLLEIEIVVRLQIQEFPVILMIKIDAPVKSINLDESPDWDIWILNENIPDLGHIC